MAAANPLWGVGKGDVRHVYIMPQLITDKTVGVYTAEPVADVIAVTFTAILFAIQFKKALKSLRIENSKEAAQ